MDLEGDKDPFQDDDDDDVRGTQDVPFSHHISQFSKQDTLEYPHCNTELPTLGNFSQPTTPARSVLLLQTDLHSSIETGHESDDELRPTMPCTGTSSGQIVPSGLVDLLNGPEPADLSWTSSMATPRIGNSTWSHLNTEERKVLLPSGECFIGGNPRALFSPDANDTVGCQSLNMTLDADTASAVKMSRERTFQTPSDINRSQRPQVKSMKWNSTPENFVSSKEVTSDTSCREVLPSNSNKPPGYDVLDLFCSPIRTPKNRPKRRRIRCSLVPSPNREDTDLVPQQNGRTDSPVLSGNIPNHLKSIHKFQEDDDSIEVATEAAKFSEILFEDAIAPKLNPSGRNSSLAESTPNRSCNKLSQPSPILAEDNMHTTDEFLKDISVTALEEICQAQEQVVSISTPLRQTDAETNYQSRKCLVFGNTCARVSNIPEVETEKNSTECSNMKDEIGSNENPVQGELDLDDSFMQQLVEMNASKISNAVCESGVKGRVQAIKKASTIGQNFLYSLQSDQVSHHIHSTQAVEPNVVVNEILNLASILDSASKISPPKTVLKSNDKFVAFNQLGVGLNCGVKFKGSHDMDATETDDLQQTLHCESDHTVVMQGKLEKQIFKGHPNPEVRDSNNARKKSLELSDDTLHKGPDQMKVTMENFDSEIPLSRSKENTDSKNNGISKARRISLADKNADDCKEDNISTLMKDEASALSDTQMAQVADDMQLLLQLMDCEEELNPWLGSECSPTAMDKEKTMPLSISVSRRDVPHNSDRSTMNGFSTAGGKAITVSEEHLEKAKLLLCDCEDGEFTSQHSVIDKKRNLTLSENLESRSVEQTEGSVYHENMVGEEFKGFTTASGTCIKISEERLKQSRLLFVEDSLEMSSTENEVPSSLKYVRDSNVHKEVISGKKQDSSSVGPSKLQALQYQKVANTFSTANGKSIKISEESLKRSRLVFQEEDLKISSTEDDILLSIKHDKEAISKSNVKSGHNIKYQNTCSKINNVNQSKRRKVPQKDVNSAATHHSSCDNQNVKAKADFGKRALDIEQHTSGFSTLNQNVVPISEATINRAGDILIEDSVTLLNSRNNVASTPEENCIKISDVVQSNHIGVHDEASSISSEQDTNLGCMLVSFDGVPSETNERLSNLKSVQPYRKRKKCTSSFFTAGGKEVSVTDQALQKAKIFFEGEVSPASTFFNELETSNGSNPLNISIKNKQSFEAQPNLGPCQGFSTASGKSVYISDGSLKKAKHLFQEFDLTNDTKHEAAQPSLSLASAHAECGEVKERDAIKHSVEAVEICTTNMGSPQLKGFSTASGKSVTVSVEALSKAKMLFKDEVQTGPSNNKELHDQTFSKTNETSFKPFVVEPHLKDNRGMKGFSTASGNCVEVSLESLAKARSMFDEQDCKENKVNNYNSSELKSRNSIERSGCFSTGNGKRITVSEESLKKARLLLEEGASNEDNCGASLSKVDNKNLCSDDLVHQHDGEKKRETCYRSLKSVQCTSFNQERNKYQHEKSNSHMLKQLCITSITQEVSESTAALLADEEFSKEVEYSSDAPSSLISICTSPSMLTDCSNSLQPNISEDRMMERAEPSTSPILITSDKRGHRRRARKGRLSLGSIPTPEQLDNLKTSLSAPIKGDSFPSSSDHVENEVQSAPIKAPRKSLDGIGEKFVTNRTNTLLQKGVYPKLNSVEKMSPVCKASTHSTPTQPPFRIPYRKALSTTKAMPSSCIQSQKRRASCIPSLEHGDVKRLKSAEERLVTLNNVFPVWSSDELTDGNEKKLRPEVLELRHRAAEEQQKYVSRGGVAKGPRLRPCTGSLLARKSMAVEERVSWSQLVGNSLPGHYTSKQLESLGVRASLFPITAENSALFRFSAWDFYSVDLCRENVSGVPVGDGALLILDDNGEAGFEEVERAFLASPGVDPSLVPQSWVKNHYRWIVWKLAAMERSFPHYFAKRCLTPHILMQQLKYRYDREIDHSQRPALRRILEHDDAAAKRMVLCVASIIQPKENKMLQEVDLELSDGWYSVVTSIDKELQHRVARGIVRVGTKLMIHGADLLNCSEGCSPLEVRGDVRLQIYSNSTRRARWYAKLGFQKNPGPFSVALSSVLGSGGVVGSVSTFVARVYPTVYMEKQAEGKTVVRSQRAETKEASKSERCRQEMAERIYNDALAEVQQCQMQRRGRQRCSTKLTSNYIAKITSGEELCELLEDASDPTAVQSMLSAEQHMLVEECLRTKQEALHRDIEVRVKKQLNSVKSGERVVIPILKLRLLDIQDVGHRCSAIFSIWRPSEDMASMFKEGQRLTVFGATANGFRCGELQLSGNRSTRYKSHQSTETPQDIQRHVSTFRSLYEPGWTPKFGELDVVGVVIKIGAPPNTDGNSSCFQVVYIADKDQTLIGVSFWGGLKDYGVEDILCPRTLLAATNLQWRGGPVMQSVPCVYASELSTFSSSPRQPYIQEPFKELRLALSKELITFVGTCNQKLEEALSLKNQPAFPRTPNPTLVGVKQGLGSPGNPMLRSSTLSPKVSTPQPATPVSSVLNGKNAAVTCSTSQSCPSNNAQRKLLMDHQALLKVNSPYSPSVERRLAKLEMYGEPPPISPIVMRQPPKSLRKEFKVPRKINSAAPFASKQDSPPMVPKGDS